MTAKDIITDWLSKPRCTSAGELADDLIARLAAAGFTIERRPQRRPFDPSAPPDPSDTIDELSAKRAWAIAMGRP